jgi:hypothetical protein
MFIRIVNPSNPSTHLSLEQVRWHLDSDNTDNTINTDDGLTIECVVHDWVGPNQEYDTTTIAINKEQATELLGHVSKIKYSVTNSGTDVDALTPDQIALIGNHHPALADLYLTSGGSAYQTHCSSRERRYMIEEYERRRKGRLVIVRAGFLIIDAHQTAVYEHLQDEMWRHNYGSEPPSPDAPPLQLPASPVI